MQNEEKLKKVEKEKYLTGKKENNRPPVYLLFYYLTGSLLFSSGGPLFTFERQYYSNADFVVNFLCCLFALLLCYLMGKHRS